MKNVEVWSEEQDRYIFTNKQRFHDDYFSLLGQVEVGVNDVKWAHKFLSVFRIISWTRIFRQAPCRIRSMVKPADTHIPIIFQPATIRDGNRCRHRLTLSHTWDHSETVDTACRKYSWDGTWMPSSGNEMNNRARTIRVYKRPLTVLNTE